MSAQLRLSAVVPLSSAHVVDAFTCADREIDAFLRERAAAEQAAGFSQVYVASDAAHAVAAYFTLSPVSVRLEPALLKPLGLVSAPYPVVGGFLLGRLGVASWLQRRGIGEALVLRAAQIAKREAAVVGGVFLAVDPKTDALVRWYATQDFSRLGAKSRRMALALSAVP